MYNFIKRIADIFFSLIALIILSPLWIVAGVGVYISDPGPIIYKSDRVGKGNKVFKMYKFRSMRIDKNATEKSLRADSSRIFKWGKIMRDTKLDELPQLVNVLIGDMSIIGPRPASVDQVAITRSGKYAITSQLKPGLSGPSALYDYIYGDQFEDEEEYKIKVLPTRLELDLCYLKKMSIVYDAKMIFYTIECIINLIIHHSSNKILDKLLNEVKNEGETNV